MSDVEALRRGLTLEEKAALTAGDGIMSTAPLERVGIPAFNVTDGPSAARGPGLPGIEGPTSTVIPCGSAVGATWNPNLAEQLGRLLGREARDRDCRVLLAPTVNLHRFPLAGRNFECYSEDPLLSGEVAASFVRGVQSAEVIATIKHFVGNESEFERSSMNSVIDERTLRELYLLPFEIAIRAGGALGLMTSYNRLNGRWLTEQPEYLTDIVRGEWGFQGLVMTDWFAVASTESSLAAGLDLEMPGPARSMGSALVDAVKNGLVRESDLDSAVDRMLGTLGRFGGLSPMTAPSEPPVPSAEDLDLVRTAATEATVLLRNAGVLPLDLGSIKRLAIIGPNAAAPCIVGGGSAQANPTSRRTPLQSLRDAVGDQLEVTYSRGCEVGDRPMTVGRTVLESPVGFEVEVFKGANFAGQPVHSLRIEELRACVFAENEAYPECEWSMRARGIVMPTESGPFQLTLAQAGLSRVFVDGTLFLDGIDSPPPPGGTEFFGMASQEAVAEIQLHEGTPIEVVVEFIRREEIVAGFCVGFRTVNGGVMKERAIEIARAADVAIVFVGSSPDWESEGRDRPTFELPGGQDDLIRRVAEVNEKTVVVVNAGAPVDLSWADQVSALLQCWLGGQGMADALADIVTGKAEPGGRLPTTIPYALRHSPAYDNFPGENGELRFGEGLFMGYRGYEHRGIAPRFPFGHGLSFTTFELGEPKLSSQVFHSGERLRISVPVRNAGARFGSEVVQCYVEAVVPRLARPVKELKAFAKLWLEPGETKEVELVLSDRSFAYWDPGQPEFGDISARLNSVLAMFDVLHERRQAGWQLDAGQYVVHIGTSSTNVISSVPIDVVPAEPDGAAVLPNQTGDEALRDVV